MLPKQPLLFSCKPDVDLLVFGRVADSAFTLFLSSNGLYFAYI